MIKTYHFSNIEYDYDSDGDKCCHTKLNDSSAW